MSGLSQEEEGVEFEMALEEWDDRERRVYVYEGFFPDEIPLKTEEGYELHREELGVKAVLREDGWFESSEGFGPKIPVRRKLQKGLLWLFHPARFEHQSAIERSIVESQLKYIRVGLFRRSPYLRGNEIVFDVYSFQKRGKRPALLGKVVPHVGLFYYEN